MRSAAPFFVSYAHKDTRDAHRLLGLLGPLMKISPDHRFSQWTDRHLLPGEHWRTEIDEALEHCCFGILLLSPEFLASDFIGMAELPTLLAKRIVVPVELHAITFDGSMDLRGLEMRHVFRDSKSRSFDECRSKFDQRQFARELYGKIVALLRKHAC